MKKLPQSNMKPAQDKYTGLYQYLMANIDEVSHLQLNHLIGICAIAGFVSLLMFAMINISTGKAYLKLSVLFGQDVPHKEKVLENMQHLLQTLLWREVTEHYV